MKRININDFFDSEDDLQFVSQYGNNETFQMSLTRIDGIANALWQSSYKKVMSQSRVNEKKYLVDLFDLKHVLLMKLCWL